MKPEEVKSSTDSQLLKALEILQGQGGTAVQGAHQGITDAPWLRFWH